MKVLLLLAFFTYALAQSDILARAGLDGSTSIASNLNDLDFTNIIGGPLTAAIDAQSSAAAASVDFIRGVSFKIDNRTGNSILQNLEFRYSEFENGTETGQFNMIIPLLTLVNIPCLEIEEVDIEFNCELQSSRKATSTDEFEYSATLGSSYAQSSGGATYDYGSYGSSQAWSQYWASAQYSRSAWTAKYTGKSKTSATGEDIEKYSLNVRVKATQSPPPVGLLDLLENLSRLIRHRDPAENVATGTAAP